MISCDEESLAKLTRMKRDPYLNGILKDNIQNEINFLDEGSLLKEVLK